MEGKKGRQKKQIMNARKNKENMKHNENMLKKRENEI